MKKVLYGVGSALLMIVLGLAVFMLFLVVPEREMVEDTVAIVAASATTRTTNEETEPHVPESHARRNDDTSEEDSSPAEASSSASSFASSSASAERTAGNTGTGSGTGRAETDDGGTGATAAQTGRGATDSGVTALSEDGRSSVTTAGTAETDTAADRPNAGNATRERTTRQQETQQDTQGQGTREREERGTTVVENPTPAPQPAGQTTQLNTGNYNSYLSVSVTDLGNGTYEAKTAPVGGGSFFNAAVTVTVRLTIDVVSDVRTVNGIEGNPTSDGLYTHTLTEETRISMYPDEAGYASTGSYWSIDRNDRLTITGLRVSLAGVNSVSGSVTR